jgi:hypothetical protein
MAVKGQSVAEVLADEIRRRIGEETITSADVCAGRRSFFPTPSLAVII